jgi:hypothetical protein
MTTANTIVAAPPYRAPFTDKQGMLTREGKNYLLSLQAQGQASPQILAAPTHLTAQAASITTTPIPLPGLSTGFYRLSVYQQILTADGVSSSLTTTLGWTNHGVAQTKALPAMTGNTTATNDGLVFPVHVDNASPITYATAYVSNTPGSMTYELTVSIEAVLG